MVNPPPTGAVNAAFDFIVQHEALAMVLGYLGGATLWFCMGADWWWYWPLHLFFEAWRDANT